MYRTRITRDLALSMAARGSGWRMFAHPLWRFVRAYFVRRGYLDGWRGFAVAQIEANYVWQKYLRLYVSQKLRETRTE